MKRSIAHYQVLFPNGSTNVHVVIVHADGVDTESESFLKDLSEAMIKSDLICADSIITEDDSPITSLDKVKGSLKDIGIWSFNNGGEFRLCDINPLPDEHYKVLETTLKKMNILNLA